MLGHCRLTPQDQRRQRNAIAQSILAREAMLSIHRPHTLTFRTWESPNAVKYFSAIELISLLADPDWLDDATKTIGQFWRRKNARRNGAAAGHRRTMSSQHDFARSKSLSLTALTRIKTSERPSEFALFS